MSYRPDKFRLNKFYRYIKSVFNFGDTVNAMTDSRLNPKVPISTLFRGMFLCVLLRFGSKRSLTKESKRHQMRKFLRCSVSFCDNTVSHGLSHIGIAPLEKELTRAPKQLKRNKAYRDTIGGLHIAALDGTEFYRSVAIHCNECLRYNIETKDGRITHYVHRVVVAQKVGTQVQSILACEKILPKDARQKGDREAGHEGELTAAKRLVDKVLRFYGVRFVDVFVTDALYMNQPFVIYLNQRGRDLIARVKDERTTLYQEICALATFVKPVCGEDKNGRLRYEIYEISNLHHSLGWDIPLRGFLVIERVRHIKNGKVTWDEQSFLCATTLKKWQASANVVRKIVHAKWAIENNGFNDLKNNWFMSHNYHHHPIATFAALLILFLAYNLFYAYVYLRMKKYRLYSLTIKEVVLEFLISFWNQKRRLNLDDFG